VQNNLQFLRHWKSNRLSSRDVIGWFSAILRAIIQTPYGISTLSLAYRKMQERNYLNILNRNCFHFYDLRVG